jgi:signal peptidase I
MSRHGIVRVAREVFLTSGALLGVVCIVATVAGFTFGTVPLVFRSGSMSPAIHTGDLAIARTVDADTLAVGDVVSVIDSGGNRVTHRVQNVAAQGNARQLTLKGDANQTPDAEVYTVTRAARVLFHLPKAGYAVDAAASPAGLFVLGLYVAGMLALVLRRRPPEDKDVPPRARRGGSRRAERPKKARAAARSVAVAVVGATLMVSSPASAAFWTDDVPVTGILTAHTVPKPAITSCSVSGGSLSQKAATIVWTEVSSPLALDYTAVIVETGQALTVTDNGATRQVVFSAGLLSTVLNQTYTVRIQANLPAPNGSWVSVVSNQPVTVGTLGLSLSCGTAT